MPAETEQRSRIGRPKTLRKPQTLNLSVDAAIKRALQKMAFDRGISASALVTEWVGERAAR